MKKILLITMAMLCAHAGFSQLSLSAVDTLDYLSDHGTYKISALTSTDFNNDGYDDVVYLKGNSIFLRLNTQANAFGAEQLLYTDPEHIDGMTEVQDVSGDGIGDVAITTLNNIKVLYAENGMLIQAFEIYRPTSNGKLMWFDLDEINKNNLAFINGTTIDYFPTVHLSGLAETAVLYENEGGHNIYDFRIDNFNNDDHLDVVEVNWQYAIVAALGNGDGTFNRYSKSLTSLAELDLGDLNLDGWKDLIFKDWNSPFAYSLIYNNETNNFVENELGYLPTFSMRLFDLKTDGTLDLVYGAIYAAENNGEGVFVHERVLGERHVWGYYYEKFNLNNDGIDDLLITDHNSFQVIGLDANGSEIENISDGYRDEFRHTLTDDLDADGRKDVITISRTGSVEVHWGAENFYQPPSIYQIPLDFFQGAVADVNLDGIKDILLTHDQRGLVVMQGTGNREFLAPTDWLQLYQVNEPQIVDVDMDDTNDVIYYQRFSPTVYWVATGTTSLESGYSSSRFIQTQGGGIVNLVTGDLNEDGYPDLVSANLETISVLINNQEDNFTETILQPQAGVSDILSVGIYDYNHDSKKDLLVIVEHNYAPRLDIYLNQSGSYVFETTIALPQTYRPNEIDVLDIDGDGDEDFIVSAWDYLSTSVFINTNGQYEQLVNVIANCGQASRIYTDLNNDNLPDVFTANFYGNKFIQWNTLDGGDELLPPIVSAGENQTFTYPVESVSLAAFAHDADGVIVDYWWNVIGGPNFPHISEPHNDLLTIRNLIPGTYIFSVLVTDSDSLTASDTVNVTILPPSNLALNKPVFASSTLTESTPGPNAVDGDMTTKWSSVNSNPQWLYVDLEDYYALDSVKIVWSGGYGRNYVIQVSNDALSWRTIKSVTDNRKLVNVHTGLTGSGRFVRMYGTAKGSEYGYAIVELEVYGNPNSLAVVDAGADQNITLPTNSVILTGSANDVDDGIIKYSWTMKSGPNTPVLNGADGLELTASSLVRGTYVFVFTATDSRNLPSSDQVTVVVNPAPLDNIALGKTTVVSSVAGAGSPGSSAVDGNYSTNWVSNSSSKAWIYVDFGNTYALNSLVINWGSAYAYNYTIDISSNGTTWTNIKTVRGNSSLINRTSLNGTARYLRVYCLAPGTNALGYSMAELEVYGKLTVASRLDVDQSEELSIQEDVQFYPNPVKELLHVTGLKNGSEVMMVNATGIPYRKVVTNESIDVQDIPSGLYILDCLNGVRKKIVKE